MFSYYICGFAQGLRWAGYDIDTHPALGHGMLVYNFKNMFRQKVAPKPVSNLLLHCFKQKIFFGVTLPFFLEHKKTILQI